MPRKPIAESSGPCRRLSKRRLCRCYASPRITYRARLSFSRSLRPISSAKGSPMIDFSRPSNLSSHGYCIYLPGVQQDTVECICIISAMWCPALFETVLRECAKSVRAATSADKRDNLLRSFAEAITHAVFPKPGEILRLPFRGENDLAVRHPDSLLSDEAAVRTPFWPVFHIALTRPMQLDRH